MQDVCKGGWELSHGRWGGLHKLTSYTEVYVYILMELCTGVICRQDHCIVRCGKLRTRSAGQTHSLTPAKMWKRESQWVLLGQDLKEKQQPGTSHKKTVSCCLSWQKWELFFVNKQEWIKRSFQLCHLLLLLMETTCKSDCWQIAQVTRVTMHSATSQP